MIQDTRITHGEGSVRVPSNGDVLRFDPKGCSWESLRDVVYAIQNTSMTRLEVCNALKTLYPGEKQFRNMSSQDVEEMAQWWKDPAYPYSYRPLFSGWQSYEEIGLRLKHALSAPKTVKPLAAAPVRLTRTASPRKERIETPLPPRHPVPNSIFTTEVSSNANKPKKLRRRHSEVAKQGTVPKPRRVKTKDDLEVEVACQQALTPSTNTDPFKTSSNRRSAKLLLSNTKASTGCGKSLSNAANDHGNSVQSHAEDNSTSDLGILPNRLPVQRSADVLPLPSKNQSQYKPMKQSLILAPPPSPSLPSSRPAKRQALGEKPTNIWQRNSVECERLPSINSLFPSEQWESLCLKAPTTAPCRIAGQDKNQIMVAEHGADPFNIYGRQERTELLPPLEGSTPPIPSLRSSSAITPTSPLAGRSRTNFHSTPSPDSITCPAPVVRKSYSDSTFKLPPSNSSSAGIRKRYSEGSLKFTAAACPWHAVRDVAIARDKMHLTNQQIALLLSHRYGTAYPSLKQVTPEQVQELWESSRTCRESLYTEQDCGVVEQQIWQDLSIL